MKGTKLLSAATWLVLACGSAQSPDSPAYSRADEVLAATPPARVAAQPSECASDGECRGECERGVVNACTRRGDQLYPGAAQRAETLWADSCKRGDAAACARLMQATASDVAVADRYGWRACVLGDEIACEFLGNAMFVRALSPAPGEDAADLLQQSARSHRLACQHGRWLGCVRAAASLKRLGDAATTAEQQDLARRGFELADKSCKDGWPQACDFLAQWAEQAGDAGKAKEAYARGCRALLEHSSPQLRPQLTEDPLCRRAKELGVAPPDLRDTSPATTLRLPHMVPGVAVEARRVSGHALIQPPLEVARYIKEKGIPVVKASAMLCLSDLGLVSDLNIDLASGSTAYDRLLFEGMRAWRYRPFVVDGKRSPVCTRVTFVYSPR